MITVQDVCIFVKVLSVSIIYQRQYNLVFRN